MLHSNLTRLINGKKLNVNVVIAFLEESIRMEESTLQANRLLNDFDRYLESEDRITQAEILLSLLRRHGGSHGSGHPGASF